MEFFLCHLVTDFPFLGTGSLKVAKPSLVGRAILISVGCDGSEVTCFLDP